jgi:hypothetical protein
MATREFIKDLKHLAEQETQGGSPALLHSLLLRRIQKLQASVTTPAEKLFHVRFGVCQSVCFRLAQQHGILQNLSKDGRATATELSVATGADELLIGKFSPHFQQKVILLRTSIVRITRPLAITGLVMEPGSRKYEANLATRFFASQGMAGGCKY